MAIGERRRGGSIEHAQDVEARALGRLAQHGALAGIEVAGTQSTARVASRPRNAAAEDLSSRSNWVAKSARETVRPRSSMLASPRGSAVTEKGSPTKLFSRENGPGARAHA